MIRLYLNTQPGKTSARGFDYAAKLIITREGLSDQPASRLIDPDVSKGVSFLLNGIGEDDFVIVKNILCLGADPKEAVDTYMELFLKAAAVFFTQESYFDSRNYLCLMKNYPSKEALANALRPAIEALAIKNFKRSGLLKKNIRDGISAASAEGRIPGRKKGSAIQTKKFKKAREIILSDSVTFGGSLSDPELIEKLGIGRNTFYRYKNRLKKTDPSL